jgi:hypothetical protein
VTSSVTPWVGGPLALLAYVGTLILTRAVDKQQLESLGGGILRKFSRAR